MQYVIRYGGNTYPIEGDIVFGSRPWWYDGGYWSRSIEVALDWENGEPELAWFDWMLSKEFFRNHKEAVRIEIEKIKAIAAAGGGVSGTIEAIAAEVAEEYGDPEAQAIIDYYTAETTEIAIEAERRENSLFKDWTWAQWLGLIAGLAVGAVGTIAVIWLIRKMIEKWKR